MIETILPGNSTPWERAVERTSAERWEMIDIDALRRAQNPQECPPHLLAWLAHNRGVDLWYDDWPDEWKRRAIERMPRLQRLKGTIAGIRGYLDLLDIKVTYYVQPPADGYLGGFVSEDERAAWLAKLPQIRVYPYRDSAAVLEGEGFVDDDMLCADDDEHGTYFGEDGDLAGERVFIWHNGVETPLQILSRAVTYKAGRRVETVQVARPSAADTDAFEDDAIEDTCFEDETGDGIITMELTEDGFGREISPIPFSQRAIATPYEYVSEAVPIAPDDYFVDDNMLIADDDEDGALFGEDEAGDHVYRRAYLSDPAVNVADIDGNLCVDEHIWDFPPYTLLVGIDISEAVNADDVRYIVGENCVEDSYFDDDDSERLERALEAVRRAQGGTDVVVVDTQIARPIRFGDAPRAGAGLKFGQMIRRTFR